MAFSMLPALRPGDWRAVICVRVCRKWEYRGGTDDGPVQHVDLVLVDEQGNNLYAEIPGTEVEAKSPLVEEGGVYVIGRFRVSNAKSAYRAVDAPYMVEFTLHTTVSVARDVAPEFPKYAYKITPIDGLAAHVGDNRNFLDTIGTLIEVSDIQTVPLSNRCAPTASRHIVLRDLSYSEIKITLWGQRAVAFTTEGIYDSNEAKPIIVLFVGGLMKSFQGNYYLSGNTACRWYFNPAIPEARQLYESFRNQRLQIRSVASPIQQRSQARPPTHLDVKTLRELNEMSPYDFSEDGYRCTVTIGRLVPNATWWFPSCNKCSKSCVRDGAGYRCIPCSNSSFKFKYKVCFIAMDGTDEAEMICFGDIARRIIGKPVQQLLRNTLSSTEYPADITKLVSLRFTFAVNISRQSYYKPQKTYNVASLVESHGHPAALDNAPHNDPVNGDRDLSHASESGDSSTKSDDDVAHHVPSAATPDSTVNTPPPKLDDIETPLAKISKKRGPSKNGRRSSARRKLLLEDDDDATAAATMGNAETSSPADEVQDSDDERFSPGRSTAEATA